LALACGLVGNICRIVVGSVMLGRPTVRWENNIEIGAREIGLRLCRDKW